MNKSEGGRKKRFTSPVFCQLPLPVYVSPSVSLFLSLALIHSVCTLPLSLLLLLV